MNTAPTSYAVRGRLSGGGAAQVEAGTETVAFDGTWGQVTSGLPGPADLLATAFAACLLKNTERAGQLLPFHYDRADVDVVVRRQDRPPKFVEISYELRLVTDESQRQVDVLHRNLRKFGTVYNTLAEACAIDGRVVTIPTGGAR